MATAPAQPEMYPPTAAGETFGAAQRLRRHLIDGVEMVATLVHLGAEYNNLLECRLQRCTGVAPSERCKNARD